MPGSDFASYPLTIRMLDASISVFFPSFSTLTRPGPSYFPQPCTHSTLFFLNRNSIPFECFLTILSFRARTLAQLIFSPLTSKPSSAPFLNRSEEHTSELQSHLNLVCRLLLEKKKKITHANDACLDT